MDAALQDLAHGMREALAIWAALLAAVFVTFVVLTLLSKRQEAKAGRSGRPSWWARLRKAIRDPEAARERQLAMERKNAELQELQRYSDEVAVAASRTSVMAGRRREEWEAAQRTQEAAWRAYEEAEKGVRRLERAQAFPLTEDDPDTRRQHMVRMVNAAHQRGELSAAHLADALMHRNGWDPTEHPFAQQLRMRRIIRDRLFRAYQQASTLEREAAAAADLAASSKRSLDDEAFSATLQVRSAPRQASLRSSSVRFQHS
ncbi:hypothetical protein GCM10009827_020470 [Dactylosporangium maewongense]|uniref:Uncharacterized protein n=1 Tax=Dactylosporangium maewongense TaxID=634393 RepID=A0ABP4KME1_9ACTN